eukprot:1158930-Pelagomonas_calceolata.AAC.5
MTLFSCLLGPLIVQEEEASPSYAGYRWNNTMLLQVQVGCDALSRKKITPPVPVHNDTLRRTRLLAQTRKEQGGQH